MEILALKKLAKIEWEDKNYAKARHQIMISQFEIFVSLLSLDAISIFSRHKQLTF